MSEPTPEGRAATERLLARWDDTFRVDRHGRLQLRRPAWAVVAATLLLASTALTVVAATTGRWGRVTLEALVVAMVVGTLLALVLGLAGLVLRGRARRPVRRAAGLAFGLALGGAGGAGVVLAVDDLVDLGLGLG